MFQPSSFLFWFGKRVLCAVTLQIPCSMHAAHSAFCAGCAKHQKVTRMLHYVCIQLAGYPSVGYIYCMCKVCSYLYIGKRSSLRHQTELTKPNFIDWFAESCVKIKAAICDYLLKLWLQDTHRRLVWLLSVCSCLTLCLTFPSLSLLSHHLSLTYSAGPSESNRGTVWFITTASEGADRWGLWRDNLCCWDGLR